MNVDVNVALELRSLRHEIAQWNAAHPDEQIGVSEMPAAQTPTVGLLKHVSALRRSLEEHERALPGGVFNAERIEVNVTATVLRTPSAVTLDENEYNCAIRPTSRIR